MFSPFMSRITDLTERLLAYERSAIDLSTRDLSGLRPPYIWLFFAADFLSLSFSALILSSLWILERISLSLYSFLLWLSLRMERKSSFCSGVIVSASFFSWIFYFSSETLLIKTSCFSASGPTYECLLARSPPFLSNFILCNSFFFRSICFFKLSATCFLLNPERWISSGPLNKLYSLSSTGTESLWSSCLLLFSRLKPLFSLSKFSLGVGN
jgi:hypothetical protein